MSIPQVTCVPLRQIRARFDEKILRVYQAFSYEIANVAVAKQRFLPPFKRARMTWIKPSFTWMMYRSGWAQKPDQEVVLGIDITRDGFEWALKHASISHFDPTLHSSKETWQAMLEASPVRVQWDPERTIQLDPLPWRTLQIGLGGEAVSRYLDQWIVRIEDLSELVTEVHSLILAGDVAGAEKLRPIEYPYDLPLQIQERILCDIGEHPAMD